MMDALHTLTDGHLRALAAALRTGRLLPPYDAVAVQRYCGDSDQSAGVAECIRRLGNGGMSPPHLALVAEAILQARTRLPAPADLVDLVWTGPEATGVANRDTSVVVRDLFGSAESELLVAGFAVYQGRKVFQRLAERMAERPGLRVRLYLNVHRPPGDGVAEAEVVRRFAEHFRDQEWPGGRLPELYYDPRSLEADPARRSSLHAKCVVIDRREALVTSANFTEAAHTRNVEVGALIRSVRFAERLAVHFEALAASGVLARVPYPDPGAG